MVEMLAYASEEAKMRFDVLPTHVFKGQSANVPAEQRSNTWTLDGDTLLQVQTYKYLGV